jgi:drug/metabolite transporter (DMT)-like permease
MNRQLFGAFAAMLFVGASWGANLPVTKVMLGSFDLMPMAAVRTAAATAALAVLLWLVEGRSALRIDLALGRFLVLGLLMGGFFACYAFGIYLSNPITAALVGVAGPLVSAATVWLVTRQGFDPGFGVALSLNLAGGLVLAAGTVLGRDATFRGGEIIVLLSSSLWTLYSLKAQAWFERESQLHRAYVASLSALGWLSLIAMAMVALGRSQQPFGVDDAWVWTQLIATAVLASGLGGYCWNIGASRLGVPVAYLWVNLVPFFAVLWAMVYGFTPNAYQIVGGVVALSGVVYMQARKLRRPIRRPVKA